MEKHKKTNIFITGAGGFVGKKMIESLAPFFQITVLEHTNPISFSEKNIIRVSGDLSSPRLWENHLHGIDTIIHMAGKTHSREIRHYFDINTHGTKNIIESAMRHGVKRFLYISTRAIGKSCGAYGESKADAEDILKQSSLEWIIIRPAEIYDNSFSSTEGIGTLARLIRKSVVVPYIADKRALLAPIHIEDVLKAITVLIRSNITNQIFTLAGPENLSMKIVEMRIADYMQKKRFFLPVPVWAITFMRAVTGETPDQLPRLVCEKETLSSNVATDLGIHPRPFLQKTISSEQ